MQASSPGELTVRPHPSTEYEYPQSRFSHLPKVPFRAGCIGPSGGGKTVLIVDLILRYYRGCFSRIYVWSPSCDIDPAWRPVKKYVRGELGVSEDEQCFFSDWDPAQVGQVIEQQRLISDYSRNKLRMKRQHGVLIVVDDFADRPDVLHSQSGGAKGSWLNSLFVRGRHLGISCLVSTQISKLCGPTIRCNATALFIFRLRNGKELYDNVLHELSALLPVPVLYQLYEAATSKPYGFLYIDLMAKTKEEMFYRCFESRLVPRAVKNDGTVPAVPSEGGTELGAQPAPGQVGVQR